MPARLAPALLLAWSGFLAGDVARPDDAVEAPSAGAGKGILYLSLDEPERPYARDIAEGFAEALAESGTPTILYREFYDQLRFGDRPSYPDEFREWLYDKYRDRAIDLIVAVQQQTLELAGQHPDSPWNSVPVVFGTLGQPTIDLRESHPGASGVVLENFFPRILEVVRTILPETRTIVAIQGSAPAERLRTDWLLPQVRENGFELLDLGGTTFEQLLERISDLPRDSVAILFAYHADASGRAFRPTQVNPRIVAAANRPVFTLMGNDLPEGLVGGVVPDFRSFGRQLGVHSLARLAGAPRSLEEFPLANYVSLRFDARELDRWKIPESRLPEGSTVHSRPPSLWRDYRKTVLVSVGIVAAQALLIVVAFFERRRRNAAEERLRASHERLQDLARRLITAQEEERSRIARDLHDDIGQRVASFSIGLSRVRRQVAEAPAAAATSLSEMQQQANALSADLRELSHDLHPSALEHLGLLQALRARCSDFRDESGVEIRFDVAEEWRDVRQEISLCLYRVAQEALRNVAAHAAARRVDLALERRDGEVVLRIVDDGDGFDPTAVASAAGLGLVSLRERVSMLGGRFDLVAAAGAGTRISVTLPVGAVDAP